jgi:hypothetical protein
MISRAWAWCRARPWTWAVAAGLVCGAGGFTTGRLYGPTRVVIQTVTEFREVAAKTTTKGPVRKTAHVVSEVLPGGGRRTTTDYVLDRGPVVTLENRTTESRTESTTTKTWEAPRLTLGLKGGASINTLEPTWGAFGHYRPWSVPLNLGVDYTRKDNVLQLTVSATF